MQGPKDRPADSPRPKMLSLEAGRGAAALFVLLFHLEVTGRINFGHYPVGNAFIWGNAGVAYFFVLSGFLMVLVHQHDLGRPGMATYFLLRRAIRILPMLWSVLIGLAVLHLLVPAALHTPLSPSGFTADVLLLPYPGPLALNPIWTLKKELLFYLFFAVTIYRPRTGWPLIVTWQLMSFLNIVLPFSKSFYGLFFFDAYNLGFGAGICAALAYLQLPHRVRTSQSFVALGLGGFVGIGLMLWLHGRFLPVGTVRPLGVELEPALEVLAAAGLLYGLLGLERAGRLSVPAWAAVAGSVSYTLYLVHEPIIAAWVKVFGSVGARLGSADLFYLVTACVVVLFAVAIHYWYERPLQRYLDGWLQPYISRQRRIAWARSPAGEPRQTGSGTRR